MPGLLLALLAFRIKEPARGSAESDGPRLTVAHEASLSSFLRLLRIRTLTTVILSQTALFFVLGADAYWLPTLLNRRFGMSVAEAGTAIGPAAATTQRHNTCIVNSSRTVARLSDKAENALNETRMLILGAQVLIGFDFQAAFQPAFDRLPATAQYLDVLALSLMLLAVGLLIAPAAFHQIVEAGNDTPRLIEYTGRVAAVALLPFAASIGIELYTVTEAVQGERFAFIPGVAGALFALFFWYGLEWVWRAREEAHGLATKEERMSEPTSVETKIKHVLTEARVVLPGVQALLGFQLTAMLTDAFGKLPRELQYIHLVSLGLLAAAMVFLMAPAAFHRIVERGEDTERVHWFSSVMIILAMLPLGLGLSADFYVVLMKVLGAPSLALGLAAAGLLFFYGVWFGVTYALRGAHPKGLSPVRAAH